MEKPIFIVLIRKMCIKVSTKVSVKRLLFCCNYTTQWGKFPNYIFLDVCLFSTEKYTQSWHLHSLMRVIRSFQWHFLWNFLVWICIEIYLCSSHIELIKNPSAYYSFDVLNFQTETYLTSYPLVRASDFVNVLFICLNYT